MSARIGIEIGTTAVRVAVISADRQSRLLGLESVPLLGDEFGSPKREEAVATAVAGALKALRRHLGAFGRPGAYLSVEGLRAITRIVELPSFDDDDLQGAVQLFAAEVTPFPIEDAVLSSRRLSGEASAPGHERVLIGIVHRELIEPLVDAVEAAGVRVLGVDLAASALVRALTKPGDADATCEALVSIGAELTTLVVHASGELVFVRTFAGGGADVTRAISRRLDVPFSEAERLKLALPSFEHIDAIEPQLLLALRDGATELINEIRGSLEGYNFQPGRQEVSRVVLCGGGALLPGLVERIALQSRLPVLLARDVRNISIGSADTHLSLIEPATYAVAVGAALSAGDRTRVLDLLPADQVERRRVRVADRAALVGAAASFVALAGLGTLHTLGEFSAEHAASSLVSANAILSRTLPDYSGAAADHDNVMRDAALVTPIVESEVNWPEVLRSLVTATPKSVSSSSFDGAASNDSPTTASAITGNHPGTDIATVQLSLSGSGYPAFQQWFASLSADPAFQIIQFSGLSSETSAVQFSAELGVSPKVQSSRGNEFKAPRP